MPTKYKQHTTKKHHGNQPKHYVKVYWPYLPLILIMFVTITLGNGWQLGNHKGVLGYAIEMSSSRLLQDTNQNREANGRADLTLNSKLSQAAQAKAQDMVNRNYWSHYAPDGTTPWYWINNAGYSYSKAGENLAYGFDTSDDTVVAWMNSPEHRDNILDSAFQDVGFGFANASNFQNSGQQTIVVAMYGTPQSAPAAPTQTATATPKATTPKTTAQSTPVASASEVQATPADTTSPEAAQADTQPTAASPSAPVTTASSPKSQPQTKGISRIQTLSHGKMPWANFALGTTIGLLVSIFAIRHMILIARALRSSEAFVVHHPYVDMAIVMVITLGVVLSNHVGFIR